MTYLDERSVQGLRPLDTYELAHELMKLPRQKIWFGRVAVDIEEGGGLPKGQAIREVKVTAHGIVLESGCHQE